MGSLVHGLAEALVTEPELKLGFRAEVDPLQKGLNLHLSKGLAIGVEFCQ
jgi:hypothetical protein